MSVAAYVGGLLQAGVEAGLVGLALLAANSLSGARASAAVRHGMLLVGLLKFATPPLLPALWPVPAGLAFASSLAAADSGGAWLVAVQVVGGCAAALGLAWSAMRLRAASGALSDAGPELSADVEALAARVGTRSPSLQLATGRVSPRVEGLGCDDLAVASGATSTAALARALVRLSETLAPARQPALAAAAAGDLRERVLRLCGPPLPRRTSLGGWRAVGLAGLGLLLLPPVAPRRGPSVALAGLSVGGLGAEELRSRRSPHGTGVGFIPAPEPVSDSPFAWSADHAARHRARHRH